MADTVHPSFTIDTQTQIDIKVQATDAILASQGYTYNEAGLSYDQAGVEYAGFSDGSEDVAPAILTINQTKPHIVI